MRGSSLFKLDDVRMRVDQLGRREACDSPVTLVSESAKKVKRNMLCFFVAYIGQGGVSQEVHK